MSVQYADDASKWALREFWWAISVLTSLKRSPPNFCPPNSARSRIGHLGLPHIPGSDRNPVSTWASKRLESTESKEILIVTSAATKVGGKGGGDLPLLGWASLATL